MVLSTFTKVRHSLTNSECCTFLFTRFGLDHHTVANIPSIQRHVVQFLATLFGCYWSANVDGNSDHVQISRESEILGLPGENGRGAGNFAKDLRSEHWSQRGRISGKHRHHFTILQLQIILKLYFAPKITIRNLHHRNRLVLSDSRQIKIVVYHQTYLYQSPS